MTIKKFLSIIITICLFIQVPYMVSAQSNEPRLNSYVVIKNIETGTVTEYQLDNAKIKHTQDENGNPVTIGTVEVGGTPANMSRAGQSNYDVFSGWKGTVAITYTNDGTYACLNSAEGSWVRVNGSTGISSRTLTYGQDLGTNSRSGSTGIVDSYAYVSTGWPKGKYGYGAGHKVGANVSAKINGNYVYVYCNLVF